MHRPGGDPAIESGARAAELSLPRHDPGEPTREHLWLEARAPLDEPSPQGFGVEHVDDDRHDGERLERGGPVAAPYRAVHQGAVAHEQSTQALTARAGDEHALRLIGVGGSRGRQWRCSEYSATAD